MLDLDKIYEEMPLNNVIFIAKEGDESAQNWIVEKFTYIIFNLIKTKNYFIPGGELADLIQEGKFGLYKAIKDFDETQGTKFSNFATLCVERQLITAIKSSTRKKHTPLNESISLNKPLKENDALTMMDVFCATPEVQYQMDWESVDPEEQLLLEEAQRIQEEILLNSLSEKEKIIYDLYLENNSYKEIMVLYQERTNKKCHNPKVVDNAIQRVKRKIKEILTQDLESLKKRI